MPPEDPHRVGLIARGDRAAGRVDEDQGVRARLAAEPLPDRERVRDVRLQGPGARVVGLVRVEAHGADDEIELPPRHARELAPTRALTHRHAVEDAMRERHIAARHQLRVLGRIEVAVRLALRDSRKESGGQRAPLDDARGVHRKLEETREHLTGVPTCRCVQLVWERAHDGVGMLQRDVAERDVADDRVDVPAKALAVVVDGSLGFHMVRPTSMELPAGPLLAELAHGHDRGHRCAGLTPRQTFDRGHDALERLAVGGPGALEEAHDEVTLTDGAELLGELAEKRGSLACLVLFVPLAGRERDRETLAVVGHASEPLLTSQTRRSGRLTRHGPTSSPQRPFGRTLQPSSASTLSASSNPFECVSFAAPMRSRNARRSSRRTRRSLPTFSVRGASCRRRSSRN